MKSKQLIRTLIIFTIIFVCARGAAVLSASSVDNLERVAVSAATSHVRRLSFEPNRGQTSKQIDFLAHGAGYTLFLSRGKAITALHSGAALQMNLAGANASSTPDPLDKQLSKSNYFIGNMPEKWHRNIANYARVRYRNVYPGVDLIYHGNQHQLEYDFVVSPGADPSKILLDFEGTVRPALEGTGDLVMHTAGGDLRWHKPVAYQEADGNRKSVDCAYAHKRGERFGFKLGAYDQAEPLIIDPVLEYSTYLGGSGGDGAQAVAVDSSGNTYVTGYTASSDFPVKNAFQSSWPGSENAFVTKFDVLGHLVYSTYLGGSGDPSNSSYGDIGKGIAVDAHGNAYITGSTASFDFPTRNAFQPYLESACAFLICPATNAFVTKLDAAGDALVYSTFLGGPGSADGWPSDHGNSIAIDAQGDAYVTGFTDSYNFPIKNAFQTTPGGIFVTKFDSSGTQVVYSTFLGVGGDSGNGIAVDSNGNAYVTGQTGDPDFPVKNAFQGTRNSYNGNAFVAKFDPPGTALVYATYLGGSGGETGNGIAVDAQGHAFVIGTTISTDFPIKNALQDKLKSKSGNAFIAKFAPAGNALVYSTYFGGSGGETGTGIAVDKYGQAYITGTTDSEDFPTKNAFQALYGGKGDAFIAKIDPGDCALVYSSFLGGSGSDIGSGVAVGAHENALVVGSTSSTDFPVTKNAFQGAPKNTTSSGFVTKVSAK